MTALHVAGFPEFLEVVERTGFGKHQVYDHVVEVDQHPFRGALALDTQGWTSRFLDLHDQIFGHRTDMPVRVTGCDHEQISQRVLSRYVDLLDVDGFEVFQGGDYEFPELFERRCVLDRVVGQMTVLCMR
jgi:hypothetical protein